MKNEKADKPGKGHQARIAAAVVASVEIDGEKTDFKVNYDITVTVEQIEYAVRKIAGAVAGAAQKVADSEFAVAGNSRE